MDCFGCLFHTLCNRLCVGVYEAENGHGNRFQKVEQMLMSGLPTESPLFCFGTVKNSPGFVQYWTKKRPCVRCLKLMK